MSGSGTSARVSTRLASSLLIVLVLASLAIPDALFAASRGPSGGAVATRQDGDAGAGAWTEVSGQVPDSHAGHDAAIDVNDGSNFRLARGDLAGLLDQAPAERLGMRASSSAPVVVALPDPTGGFQRFALTDSPVMEPGLAAQHPDISTYRGRRHRRPDGHDPRRPDPARLPRLGPVALWRLVHRPATTTATRACTPRTSGAISKTPMAYSSSATPTAARCTPTRLPTTRPTRLRSPAPASRPTPPSRSRSRIPTRAGRRARCRPRPNADGSFSTSFVADPDGHLDTHVVEVSDGQTERVGQLPGRPRRRPDGRPADRRRAAHLPPGAHHRPRLRHLLRRLGQRHGGQGHPDQPRQPALRGGPVDPPEAGRQQRPAQPRHVGQGDRRRTGRAAPPRASRSRR